MVLYTDPPPPTPLGKIQIERLRQQKNIKNDNKEDIKKVRTFNIADTCSICLGTFSNDIVLLKCNHVLHKKCFDELEKCSNNLGKCPLCRTII